MFENYLTNLSSSLGIGLVTLIGIIVLWDLAWRCAAVWKSTKNNQPIWSIAFVLFQTIGILPIFYIFVFSKINLKKKGKKPKKKKRK